MAQLYLPVEHTEADLVLAGQIAESIDSAELYVTWTPDHGHSAPQVSAELRANEWNMTRTAERLGIERSHLYRKIKAYGITPPK